MEENYGGELNPFAEPHRPSQNGSVQNPYQNGPVQDPYQNSPGQNLYQNSPGQNPYKNGPVQNPFQNGPVQNPFQPGGYSSDVQNYDPYMGVQTYSESLPEPRVKEKAGKNGIGKWIGLSAGVLALGAVLVLWLLGFFHSKNGTYIWDDYQVFGMTVELKIDGDTGDLTITADGKPQTQKCDVTFDSDRVVLSMNGKYLNCSYNRKKQTITIPDDTYLNSDLVLEKE